MDGIFDENLEDSIENPSDYRAIAYCDHCGFAIYTAEEAFLVKGSRDIIHTDCWEEYAADHMFDFVMKADEDGRFGHGL